MRHFNRVVLVLIAVSLIAAGVLGLLVTTEVVSASTINSWIGYQEVFDWWRGRDWTRDGSLWILIGAGMTVLIFSLFLIWLEVRPRGLSAPRRAPIGGSLAGRTELHTKPLAKAIARDVELAPGVTSAQVRQLDPRQSPLQVALVIDLAPDGDAAAAGRAACGRAAAGVESAYGREATEVVTTVKARRPSSAQRDGRVE